MHQKEKKIETTDTLKMYFSSLGEYNVLDPEAQKLLLVKAQSGDENARDLLVSSSLRFVIKIARQYHRRGLPLYELISEGNLGLFDAIEKFEIGRENNFISYAVWWIRYYITRAIQQSSNTIRLPMNHIRESQQVKRLYEMKKNEHENPTTDAPHDDEIAHIADVLDLPEARVRWLLAADLDVYSLEREVSVSKDGGSVALIDLVADEHGDTPFEAYTDGEMRDILEHCLNSIPKREADIIRHRYGITSGKPVPLRVLSEEYGLTKERIRQLETRGLQRIRMHMNEMNMQTAV